MRISILAIFLVAAVLAVSLSCQLQAVEWTVDVQPVSSPAGPNTSGPQITDSLQGPILSWVQRDGNTTHLKFAERDGSGWSAPRTAVSGDDWFLSYADAPSVTRLINGTLVAQWGQVLDLIREAYNLRLSYSTDGGSTWATPFLPHHDGTSFQHGFASLFELPGGTLGLVWLDGRNSEFFEDDPTSGTMTLRYAAYDANWTQIVDTEVDHRVCECCPTTAVVTADGVLTAYRDRSDQEVRDIAVSRLENGRWTPPTMVNPDGWKTEYCPVNGPMLSARGRDVVVAWYRVADDQGQAYAAFSTDVGRTWGPPIRLDDSGSLGRVDVEMLEDGSAVASWVEYTEQRADFRIRRIERSGARSAPRSIAPVSSSRGSGFPRMGRHGNELVFAWSESGPDGSEPRIQTAVARLP